MACRSLPEGQSGPAADALARRMLSAVNASAWANTGAVTFVFAGQNRHLWDRTRGFSRVEWGDTIAWLDLSQRRGVAVREGQTLEGEDVSAAVDDAYGKWVNDTFWLNPVVKVFDEGVVRSRVDVDAKTGLLVRYTSGGRTPGDAYLWWVDADGRPVAWQMWTSNIPIGGLEASWEGWIELDTGAWVATRHEILFKTLELTEVRGAETLAALLSSPTPSDPFEKLRSLCHREDPARSCGAFN
ncbi:MAG: hypothetical protein IPK13_12250 [Deltaproteobacteria bacterium]|nr:hypothetical protein [Deltaproteobacteria bacterium]